MGAHNKELLMFDLVHAHYLIPNTANQRQKKNNSDEDEQKISCRLLTLWIFFHSFKSIIFFSSQTDKLMPVRFDEELLIWVAGGQPLKDTSFLSNKILGLCRDLPIYWLQPISPKGSFLFIFHFMIC